VRGAGCDCLGLLRGVWRDLMGDEPESAPPYSEDWAESSGREDMYAAFKRHFEEIDPLLLAPGDIALFRMLTRSPAKHCGIIGRELPLPLRVERACCPRAVRGRGMTLIHSRANTRVTEEPLTAAWRRKLAYAFRL
jgi:NlpC/P60 family putative phage cell wall peptidase